MPEIIIIPNDVAIYLRFSTEEEARKAPLILKKSEAEKLCEKLLNKIKKVPDRISLNGSDK